jgi:RNA polymerase sigma factor (sigma-70 family)
MTDGQLLECFVARRDEAAFEALVRRYGPMVLGTCRRVLRHSQDAEDAFQAAFLVLARKAASIGQRELLGNWLYGVAYRTALDARAAAARRRARERQVNPLPEPAREDASTTDHDLRALLDREVNRLPNRYRVAVALCDLEGRTRQDAAQQLGIPVGTLSGRLTTARRMLARRLARHGLVLSGAAWAAAWSQQAAAACVSPQLVASTVGFSVGKAVAEVVSVRVVALAEGVLKGMLVKKLKTVAIVVLLAATVLGGGLLAYQPMAAEQPVVAARPGAEPPEADKATRDPRVLHLHSRGRRVVWSPDGKTLLVVTKYESLFFGRNGSAIHVWDVEKGEVKHALAEDPGKGLAFQYAAFSADGRTIAATASEEVRAVGSAEIRTVVKLWDARTFALKRTLVGATHLVHFAISPDGKLLAGCDPSAKTMHLWDTGTGALVRHLDTDGAAPWSAAFSPDGKVLIVAAQKGGVGEMTLWNAADWTRKDTLKPAKFVQAVAFSPDGKRVVTSDGRNLLQVWQLEKGSGIVTLEGNKHYPRSVVFSPDNKIVAAAGWDAKVRFWDVASGTLQETLEGHDLEIYGLAFSPDGKTLASVSQDETLRLWPIRKPSAGPRER